MDDWHFIPTNTDDDLPTCPFCKEPMALKEMSYEDRLHQNIWECVGVKRCKRKTLLTLQFEL